MLFAQRPLAAIEHAYDLTTPRGELTLLDWGSRARMGRRDCTELDIRIMDRGPVGVVMQQALDPGSGEVILTAQDDTEYYRETASHHVMESLSERMH